MPKPKENLTPGEKHRKLLENDAKYMRGEIPLEEYKEKEALYRPDIVKILKYLARRRIV